MCFQYRSWAKYLGGGGQPGRAKPMGVRGKKTCKLLKFSFLKSLQMHPILKLAHIYGDLIYYYFFLSISRKLLGGAAPPAPPLVTALALSVFQFFYVQIPAVFRNGRPIQSIRY